MNVDDIVGETFLAAWRRRHELPADPRPWLFGAARNVMLNADRTMRRHSPLPTRKSSRCTSGRGWAPGTRPPSSAARARPTPCA
ncbi:RNA polymerase sigma factor [Streptomyces sp. BH055]